MTARPTVPALILGGHLTGLGTLRLMAARRIPSFVGGVGRYDMVAHSRWFRPAPIELDESPNSDRLAEALLTMSWARAVLLPCTDSWAQAVAGLPDHVRARYPSSVPSRAVIDEFVDKDRFNALITGLGLAAPRSLTLRSEHDLTSATDSEIAGSFLKPIQSQSFAARFHKKGFWVRDRAEASTRIREARAAGVGLMLQEWIPGDASHNLHVDCFVDRHGRIAGTVARRKIRRHPAMLGNTASAVSVPLTDVADAVSTTHRIIEAVGHRGVASAEYKYDARDGQFKILEVNSRLFWHVAHSAAAGLDLAWLSYLDALEEPVPRVKYRTGVYGIYEINDAAALKAAWAAGERELGPVLRPWLLGNRALFWWRDPAPALMEIGVHARRRVVRRFGLSGRPLGRLAGERQDLPRPDEDETQPGRHRYPSESAEDA